MPARKTAAEKFADYEQLKQAAHKRVDELDRKALRKFLSSNGPVKLGATNDQSRTNSNS